MTKENYHILVIDDNEDILFMIKTMLEMKGYRISAKDNPDDIESFIEQTRPDVILMDLLLSGSDGREICKKLKENKLISHISVVMISALPDAAIICKDAGTDYFLGKPFEMNDLFETINNALSLILISKISI